MNWISIALFGALGCLSRSIAQITLNPPIGSLSSGFPVGTFMVNALGSLLAGALAAWVQFRPDLPEWLKLGLMAGFLGGFTTFSAFSTETWQLFRSAQWGSALAYFIATPLCAFLGVALGWMITSRFSSGV